MTLQVAISIGKGMRNLIKVDKVNGDKKTFRSYLRLLVEFDVRNPLKPGFPFKRDGGESILIFLKYERLDVYCVSCGRIGHNQSHCMAPPEERFPKRYEISLKHNIFSNILPTSPSPHPKSATTLSPTQFSQVQTLENELTHPSSTPKDPVPTQSNPTHLHPNQKLIPTIHSQVQNNHTSHNTPLNAATPNPPTITTDDTLSTQNPPLLHQHTIQPTLTMQPQPTTHTYSQNSLFKTGFYSSTPNLKKGGPHSKAHQKTQPSFSINLACSPTKNLTQTSTSEKPHNSTNLTNFSKMPANNLNHKPSSSELTKDTSIPHQPPPDPPRARKRTRQTGNLIPLKKGSSTSKLTALTPEDMEIPIPKNVIPTTTVNLQARTFLKANRKNKFIVSTTISSTIAFENVTVNSFDSGDHVVSPKGI